jgi:hypothetical protein
MQSLNLTDEVGKLAEIGRTGARANRAYGSDQNVLSFYKSFHPNYSYNPDFIFIHKQISVSAKVDVLPESREPELVELTSRLKDSNSSSYY